MAGLLQVISEILIMGNNITIVNIMDDGPIWV